MRLAPFAHWYECLNDTTLADAILDRLLHNAIRIELKGESMRKKQKGLQEIIT
jgi:DNA replication protein DnaC